VDVHGTPGTGTAAGFTGGGACVVGGVVVVGGALVVVGAGVVVAVSVVVLAAVFADPAASTCVSVPLAEPDEHAASVAIAAAAVSPRMIFFARTRPPTRRPPVPGWH
jgi:hypothetical protein